MGSHNRRVSRHENALTGNGLPIIGGKGRITVPRDVDSLNRHLQFFGRDLGQCRIGSLTVVNQRSHQIDRSVLVELENDSGRCKSRHGRCLVEESDPLSPDLSTLPLFLSLFLGFIPSPFDLLCHSFQTLVWPACMVGDLFSGYGGGPRHEDVFHPEFNRVHSQLSGHDIHVTLDTPEGLHMPKPPIGRPKYLIGIDDVRIYLTVINLVRTRS